MSDLNLPIGFCIAPLVGPAELLDLLVGWEPVSAHDLIAPEGSQAEVESVKPHRRGGDFNFRDLLAVRFTVRAPSGQLNSRGCVFQRTGCFDGPNPELGLDNMFRRILTPEDPHEIFDRLLKEDPTGFGARGLGIGHRGKFFISNHSLRLAFWFFYAFVKDRMKAKATFIGSQDELSIARKVSDAEMEGFRLGYRLGHYIREAELESEMQETIRLGLASADRLAESGAKTSETVSANADARWRARALSIAKSLRAKYPDMPNKEIAAEIEEKIPEGERPKLRVILQKIAEWEGDPTSGLVPAAAG